MGVVSPASALPLLLGSVTRDEQRIQLWAQHRENNVHWEDVVCDQVYTVVALQCGAECIGKGVLSARRGWVAAPPSGSAPAA